LSALTTSLAASIKRSIEVARLSATEMGFFSRDFIRTFYEIASTKSFPKVWWEKVGLTLSGTRLLAWAPETFKVSSKF
jgi:hypothetical protein